MPAPCHLSIAILCLTTTAPVLAAQRCDAPHYRWSAKVSTAFARQRPETTSIETILAQWSIAPLWPGSEYWCAGRLGRERVVYTLVGWLRDADTTKDDGDWHLELTQAPDDPRERCIVAEIPAPRWGEPYANARATLDTLLRTSRWRRRGHVDPAIRIRIIGPAFFDAEHVHGARRPRAEGHGRCNSSLLALWEIHPVYRVERP